MLVIVDFDAKALSHSDYDIIFLPVFEQQENIHASDAASSNIIEARAEVEEVIVCKPAVGEGPGL